MQSHAERQRPDGERRVRLTPLIGKTSQTYTRKSVSTGHTTHGYSEYRMALTHNSLIQWRSSELAVINRCKSELQ